MREGRGASAGVLLRVRHAIGSIEDEDGDAEQSSTPTNLDGEEGDVKAVARAKVHETPMLGPATVFNPGLRSGRRLNHPRV
jgi:hypothetical protein